MLDNLAVPTRLQTSEEDLLLIDILSGGRVGRGVQPSSSAAGEQSGAILR